MISGPVALKEAGIKDPGQPLYLFLDIVIDEVETQLQEQIAMFSQDLQLAFSSA